MQQYVENSLAHSILQGDLIPGKAIELIVRNEQIQAVQN
ncbi:MAG: hypothetical protein ACRC9T_03500 [Vibrionaceae bacterium]